MNCSTVMEDLGILRSNDLPVPRWSQLTTVKLFSSGALK